MDSALLSSRDGYPLEPKSGLNGVKPPVELGSSTYRKEGRKQDWVEGQTELQGSSKKALADPRELCSVCRPLELSCIG